MTSKEKIEDILDFIDDLGISWSMVKILKMSLEALVIIAQTEGIMEARKITEESHLENQREN